MENNEIDIETNSLIQAEVLAGIQGVCDALPNLNLGEFHQWAKLTRTDIAVANKLFEIANQSGIDVLQEYIEKNPLNARTIAFLVITVQCQTRSKNSKKAADVMHDKNGNRAKRDAIRQIWASGKYSSRDICAEQECAALEMSFSTARKALQNTLAPT
ncbi:hypothetical protein [Undibacterium sp. Ji49W]|uniref:hypothetical protein n=1 Tax=Undibacterium sp. Ji49W TaxID=3413040 RepID=UPI003BF051E3